jgi:hypothetical protein
MKDIGALIPRQHLKVYRRVYEKIEALNLRSLADDRWKKPFDDIEDNLRILAACGFLNKCDIAEIKRYIFTCAAKRGPSFLKLSIPDLLSLRHKGPIRRDAALNFLIYALCYDCRALTGKPHYSAIADYLKRAKIYSNAKNETFAADDLRKRAKRLDESDVSSTVLFASVLCDRDDPLIPPDMAAGYDPRGYLKNLRHDPFDPPPGNNPFSIPKRP